MAAEEDQFRIGSGSDKHLEGWMSVVAEKDGEKTKYHVGTVVKHKHRTGPVYFNLIKPFHHIIARRMGRIAAD